MKTGEVNHTDLSEYPHQCNGALGKATLGGITFGPLLLMPTRMQKDRVRPRLCQNVNALHGSWRLASLRPLTLLLHERQCNFVASINAHYLFLHSLGPKRSLGPFQSGHPYGKILPIHAGYHLQTTCEPASVDTTCDVSTF
jgi:hypothetical protein